MTTPLESAIRSVAKLKGEATAHALDRVDVRPDGTLFLTGIDESEETCWYRFSQGELSLQSPWNDEKLPVVRYVGERASERWLVHTWRPGRRVVIQDRTTIGPRPILKGYRRKRSGVAAARHRAAYRSAAESGFSVARLDDYKPAQELLIFRPLLGVPLALSEKSADNVFRIGVSLAHLQSVEPRESLEIHSAANELAVVERWIRFRESATTQASAEERKLLADLHSLAMELPYAEPRLCHRDLHDGQFLVSPGTISVLDFDLLCLADSALDASNLIAHFSLRALQRANGATLASARLLGDALIDGLDSSDPNFWRRMRFYQATAFLRLSQLYALRPKWNEIVPDLLQLARKCTIETHTV